MDSSRQRGKADLTTLVFFVVLGFVFWAGWRVIPVYYDHYAFRDQVEEICRIPAYKARNPEIIYEKLLRATRDAQLDDVDSPPELRCDVHRESPEDRAVLRARGGDPARLEAHLQVRDDLGSTAHLIRERSRAVDPECPEACSSSTMRSRSSSP